MYETYLDNIVIDFIKKEEGCGKFIEGVIYNPPTYVLEEEFAILVYHPESIEVEIMRFKKRFMPIREGEWMRRGEFLLCNCILEMAEMGAERREERQETKGQIKRERERGRMLKKLMQKEI